MVYLALRKEETNNFAGVKEVSEAIGSPKAFTAKILQQLSKADLLDSIRGPNGGFSLFNDSRVSLADIVRAIDGNQLIEGCVLGFKECSDRRPCPAHFRFKSVRDYLNDALLTTDIEEMKQIIQNGNGFIKY